MSGKTLKDYNSPDNEISELTDIRGGVTQYSDNPRATNLPPVSFMAVRGRQTKDESEEEPNDFDKERPPFFPTLLIDESGVKLRMVTGYIHTQGNVEGEVMGDLEVVGIPVEGSEIPITNGTKCFVSAQEDAYGIITDPQFGTGADWPTSVAPKLVGGDDQTGTPGVRYWRLCEITVVAEVGEETLATAKIHRTGIIEHFIPRRVENATYLPSTDEGTLFQEYLSEDHGVYQMRTAKGLRGLKIQEQESYLKLMMPEGTDGAVLYFTDGVDFDPELGGWVALPAPSESPADGSNWLLKNDPGGDPTWLEIANLPTGAQGDMLFWDGGTPAEGGKWVLLPAPPAVSASEANILSHDGFTPEWETFERLEVSLCINNSASTGEILIKNLMPV